MNTIESFAASIAGLTAGATASKALRLDGDEATKQTINDRLQAMRNSVAAAVSRATKKTGHVYTVETATNWTKTYDVLLFIAITRTA